MQELFSLFLGMNLSICSVLVWAGLFLPLSVTYAQGTFRSTWTITTPTESSDTLSSVSPGSFPVTQLGGASAAPVTAAALLKEPDTTIDGNRESPTPPDTAAIRMDAVNPKEVGLVAPAALDKAEHSLSRLRNVPAIPPLFIAPSSVDKKTGLARTRMSSGFGIRQHPISGNLASHAGIDLPAALGTLVYATADGICQQVIDQPGGIGLAVYLSHNQGHQTLYGHLLSSRIKPGQTVVRGQAIGRVGMSGLTTGPHLHYGVRYNGQVVDPLPYCFLLSVPGPAKR